VRVEIAIILAYISNCLDEPGVYGKFDHFTFFIDSLGSAGVILEVAVIGIILITPIFVPPRIATDLNPVCRLPNC